MARIDAVNEADLPKSDRNFDPIPPGWYRATITEAELKNTNAGTGNYIKLRYDIVGPTAQGRVVFGNLNMKNPNPEAERIGRQQLGELMRAIGLPRVDDTDQLVGKTCDIKLVVKAAQGQYEASNEVKAWKAVEGGAMPAPTAGGASQAAKSSAAPPWAKK